MYEAFFGMKERPFALTPDPAFLFLSAKHSMALSMLEYSLSGQAGFTVVTGEIGSGKTTLIRKFLKESGQTTNLGVISNTHTAFGDLLQWVLLAYGIETSAADKASRYQAFVKHLIEQYGAGRQTVLIVDEAQNLSIEALEELRLLSNVNADKDQLLQMILVGQPELLESLKRPELKQFAQRISVHYHLVPLSHSETCSYVRHRLHVAGADREIFDKFALGAIYYFSNGVPRLINSICDMALVYGFAESKIVVDIDTVLSVVRDREKGALLMLPRSSEGLSPQILMKLSALVSESEPAVVMALPAGEVVAPTAPIASAEISNGHPVDLDSSVDSPATDNVLLDRATEHRVQVPPIDDGLAGSAGAGARDAKSGGRRWLWW